jgi:hypothetical protein
MEAPITPPPRITTRARSGVFTAMTVCSSKL